MKRNPWITIVVLVLLFGSIFWYLTRNLDIETDSGTASLTSKNLIATLELNGVIDDSEKFLRQLKKLEKKSKVKAVVLKINSPGGVVGPSQEIYYEIKRFREETKKPVVVATSALDASGAYYASVAADKIVVNEGTLMGSIGVIMEFANLEKLYDWAKISRYSITSGKFKDSGAEYRAMREDERELFQNLINDVYEQFKMAVAQGRNLKPELVAQYADGRIMTGAQAVKLGFADQVGTFQDAVKVAADLAKLGDDYDVLEAPRKRAGIMSLLNSEDGDWESKAKKILKVNLLNRPLYMMPGYWE